MAQSYESSLKNRIFTQGALIIMALWITVSGAHGFMGEVTDVNSGDTLVANVQGQMRPSVTCGPLPWRIRLRWKSSRRMCSA